MATQISITYTKNTKNKFDFSVIQNGVPLFFKTYSPVIKQMQHFLGYSLAIVAQQKVDAELASNPEFAWSDFNDFKSWLGNPELREDALAYYDKHIEEWAKNPAKGW
jgi:hypothetical protein